MIDLNHNYALLKDGTIESLWYGNDHSDILNQRMAYKDEDVVKVYHSLPPRYRANL